MVKSSLRTFSLTKPTKIPAQEDMATILRDCATKLREIRPKKGAVGHPR
jgi:hypothetical protein